MNRSFIAGFEKQAGLANLVGKVTAKVTKIPSSIKNFVTAIPKAPGKVLQRIKARDARVKRARTLAYDKALGPALRKERGRGYRYKDLDYSAKVPKMEIEQKESTFKKARNLAAVGIGAGSLGAYYGMKDKEVPGQETGHAQ